MCPRGQMAQYQRPLPVPEIQKETSTYLDTAFLKSEFIKKYGPSARFWQYTLISDMK